MKRKLNRLLDCPDVDCPRTKPMVFKHGKMGSRVTNITVQCPICGLVATHQFAYFSTSLKSTIILKEKKE